MIPNDVSQYSLAQNNLRRETSAIRIDETYPPYPAVIGVHSLQRKVGAGLIIQQVAILLDAVDTAPTPLNVWTTGAPNDFAGNPYLVTFRGEAAGARLIAASIHTTPTYTDLREGESDEIDLQFTARQVGANRFHVEVAYTVKGDAVVHVVALTKHDFAVVFGDATNWHRYQLGPDGHFALAGS